ncbi:hypothetical protein GWI33_011008, partial [Rhynchophorus ferrugineus]
MQHYRTVMFMVLLGLPTWCFAQLLSWNDPIPDALAPFANNVQLVAKLANQDILIYSHPVQKLQFNSKKGLRKYNQAQFSSAALVVTATPQQIHDVLKNYSGYVGLFPTLKKAKIIESKDNMSQVKYRIRIPTPIKILNFNEDIIIQHQLTENSLSSLIVDAPIS